MQPTFCINREVDGSRLVVAAAEDSITAWNRTTMERFSKICYNYSLKFTSILLLMDTEAHSAIFPFTLFTVFTIKLVECMLVIRSCVLKIHLVGKMDYIK
jgi:hypothetical protein